MNPIKINIMKSIVTVAFLFLTWILSAGEMSEVVTSPNGHIKVVVSLSKKGKIQYEVAFKNKKLIGKSKLGVLLENRDLTEGFSLENIKRNSVDEVWDQVWGEESKVRNHYNELAFVFKNNKGHLGVIFRIFDDGVGFRYQILSENGKKEDLLVKEEVSEFDLEEDMKGFWQPSDWDSNEHVYETTKISKIDGFKSVREGSIHTQFIPDFKAVQTPIALVGKKVHIALHEAALVDYPAMHLKVDNENFKFTSFLIPNAALWQKAKITTPFNTPWRTIIISEDAAGLLRSRMILNLNEPCKIKETSWIKPMKYMGIWWEMHLGKSSWEYLDKNTMKPNGKHGATNANTRKYIDFASKNGFGGVLVEGWNTGWEDWFGFWKEEIFDFQTPYPDYDLPALAKYSIEKKCPIIVHHETSAAVTTYEKYLTPAFDLMKKNGLNAIKSGYVGRIIPKGEWHDGQWMINHYNRVIEKAAEYKIMVDAHEPVRPTGLHRTWPNFMASEAARGNEFNGWSSGNPPEHETILPFTRLLGGPMDYTPGIFNIQFKEYKDKNNTNQVHTTLCKQLALYITMYSPLQMAADFPEHYEKHMDAFQFIKDVAVDWDESKILNASIGNYVTIVRKEKGKENWFLGSISDEHPREFDLTFDFLKEGVNYEMVIYADGKNAHWKENPTSYEISKRSVKKNDKVKIKLASGGGCAISLMSK